MTDIIKFLRELGIDMDGKQVERIEQWLNTDRAENWDDGARAAGRYGHEDYWDNGGPHRENPYKTEEQIIEEYGEADW